MFRDKALPRLVSHDAFIRIGAPDQAARHRQCAVRTMSETGAHLEIPSGAFLPDCFVPDVPVRVMRVPSAVVWRKPAAVGVR
jgi:hypothetical protein